MSKDSAALRLVDAREARDALEDLVTAVEPDPEMAKWVLEKPSRPGAGSVLAIEGDCAQGYLAWAPHPGFDGVAQQYLNLLLRQGGDDVGVAALLFDAAAQRLGDASHPACAWMHLEERTAHLQGVLEARGFQHQFTTLEYRGALPLPALEPQPQARLVRYRGGDDSVNAAIADVHRRGYAGRAGTPLFTPDGLERAARMVLAYEDEQLAGFVSWAPLQDHALCDSIVVARRHFGTGMAHVLGCAFSDDAAEAGSEEVRCYVHTTNHASRSLVERFGLEVHAQVRSFSRSFS